MTTYKVAVDFHGGLGVRARCICNDCGQAFHISEWGENVSGREVSPIFAEHHEGGCSDERTDWEKHCDTMREFIASQGEDLSHFDYQYPASAWSQRAG